MPTFPPSTTKVATISLPISPQGLNCTGEIWLTTDGITKAATSGPVPFVSTGVSQSIPLPVTMPATLGSYTANIDIMSGGLFLGAYQASEPVVISPPGVSTTTLAAFLNALTLNPPYPWQPVRSWLSIVPAGYTQAGAAATYGHYLVGRDAGEDGIFFQTSEEVANIYGGEGGTVADVTAAARAAYLDRLQTQDPAAYKALIAQYGG